MYIYLQSTDSIEKLETFDVYIYIYGMSKDLLSKKEVIKFNDITKRYKYD